MEAEGLPEAPWLPEAHGYEPGPASRDEEGWLTDRTVNPEGDLPAGRLVRRGYGLDVGQEDHGAEVPTLSQDETGPGEPMLREERRKDEQDSVGDEDPSEDGRRQQGEGRSEGHRQGDEGDEPDQEPEPPDHKGSTVGEREAFGRHGPAQRTSTE